MPDGRDTAAGATLVVPPELNGLRAAEVLQRLLPAAHRHAIRRLVRDGRVLLNAGELQPWKKLRAGDLLMFAAGAEPESLPSFEAETARDPAPRVLHDDAACAVLDKPAGIATVPERHGETSVHARLADWFPGRDLRIVHRLDKDTSGVLVLAEGREGAAAFDRMFREHRIDKAYVALVRGRPRAESFVCETPLGRTVRGGRVRTGAGKGARAARTEFRVLGRYRGFTWIEARPRTGRTHQVRAHLASLGLSLAVDPLYGGARELRLSEFKADYRTRRGKREQPLISRLTLHAARIRFVSPAGGETVAVEADLPKDLRLALAKLDRFAAVGGEA